MHRICSVCQRVLDIDEFPRDASRKSGRMDRCRSCDNERCRRYYAENYVPKAGGEPRKCATCDQPATSSRHRYCDVCRRNRKRHWGRERERRRIRSTPTERGYGTEHQKLRRRFARLVESGLCNCARCGEPISAFEPWDLGHDDDDRSKYSGPEHRRCNRATASRRKRQTSRVW